MSICRKTSSVPAWLWLMLLLILPGTAGGQVTKRINLGNTGYYDAGVFGGQMYIMLSTRQDKLAQGFRCRCLFLDKDLRAQDSVQYVFPEKVDFKQTIPSDHRMIHLFSSFKTHYLIVTNQKGIEQYRTMLSSKAFGKFFPPFQPSRADFDLLAVRHVQEEDLLIVRAYHWVEDPGYRHPPKTRVYRKRKVVGDMAGISLQSGLIRWQIRPLPSWNVNKISDREVVTLIEHKDFLPTYSLETYSIVDGHKTGFMPVPGDGHRVSSDIMSTGDTLVLTGVQSKRANTRNGQLFITTYDLNSHKLILDQVDSANTLPGKGFDIGYSNTDEHGNLILLGQSRDGSDVMHLLHAKIALKSGTTLTFGSYPMWHRQDASYLYNDKRVIILGDYDINSNEDTMPTAAWTYDLNDLSKPPIWIGDLHGFDKVLMVSDGLVTFSRSRNALTMTKFLPRK